MIGIMQGRLSPSEELMFFPFATWEKEFAIAQDIGFDAIEWAFYETDYEKNPILSEKGIERINHIAKKYNIRTDTLCAGYFIQHGFTGDNTEKSVAMLKQLIQNGSQIGVKIILIPFLGDSEIKNEKQKEETVKNLSTCLKTAEQHDTLLALETSLPAKELKDFVGMFKHPLIKVYYDVGNCTTLVGNKVLNEIRALGNLIAAVHIKDRKCGGTTSLPLGRGDADFPNIFRVLKEIGFDGPLVLEAARDKNVDDIALNKEYLKFVKDNALP